MATGNSGLQSLLSTAKKWGMNNHLKKAFSSCSGKISRSFLIWSTSASSLITQAVHIAPRNSVGRLLVCLSFKLQEARRLWVWVRLVRGGSRRKCFLEWWYFWDGRKRRRMELTTVLLIVEQKINHMSSTWGWDSFLKANMLSTLKFDGSIKKKRNKLVCECILRFLSIWRPPSSAVTKNLSIKFSLTTPETTQKSNY